MSDTSIDTGPSSSTTAADVVEVTPSLRRGVRVSADSPGTGFGDIDAIAVLVGPDGDLPEEIGYDRAALARAGFRGAVGQALALPTTDGPARVAVGTGPVDALDLAVLRRAAAAFARALPDDARLGARVPALAGVPVADAAAAIVEGILLGRYRFDLASR